MSNGDTKERILDAAERLFGERGFLGTSLRSVTAEASVNVAAVHYHFGSKQALVEAVLARRATPMNEERLRLLDELEAACAGPELPLEGVLRAFFAPVIRMHFEPGSGIQLLPRLMSRAITDAGEDMPGIIRRIFAEIFACVRSLICPCRVEILICTNSPP